MSKDEKILLVLVLVALVAIVAFGRSKKVEPALSVGGSATDEGNGEVPAYLGAAMPYGFPMAYSDIPTPLQSRQLDGGNATPAISWNSASGCRDC